MFQISEKGRLNSTILKKRGLSSTAGCKKGGGAIPRNLPTNVKNGYDMKHCVGMIAILRTALLFPSIFCTKLCYE